MARVSEPSLGHKITRCPELLLLSNSISPGMGFLEHARAVISGLVPPGPAAVRAVRGQPTTDATRRCDARRRAAFGPGHRRPPGPATRSALAGADAVFVGGGNSFRLLRALQDTGLVAAIAERVRAGLPYLGVQRRHEHGLPHPAHDQRHADRASQRRFAALGLIPFQINPHYLDPDPASTHQGETRPQRIERVPRGQRRSRARPAGGLVAAGQRRAGPHRRYHLGAAVHPRRRAPRAAARRRT